MKKIVFIIVSSFFTTFVFSQQQSQQPPQQIQNRILNLSNILIQNVSNTNLNYNDNNNVQVISNPRPRQRINRPRRSNISSNNATVNKTPIISQRRIARRPPRRPVARTTTNTISINPIVSTNLSLGNGEVKSTHNVVNSTDVPLQNSLSNVSKNIQVQTGSVNSDNQSNFSISFSLNQKSTTSVKSSSSSSSNSSAHYKSRTVSKKFAKFKRHFFGKLTAHKKSKRRIDICFNWKS